MLNSVSCLRLLDVVFVKNITAWHECLWCAHVCAGTIVTFSFVSVADTQPVPV